MLGPGVTTVRGFIHLPMATTARGFMLGPMARTAVVFMHPVLNQTESMQKRAGQITGTGYAPLTICMPSGTKVAAVI